MWTAGGCNRGASKCQAYDPLDCQWDVVSLNICDNGNGGGSSADLNDGFQKIEHVGNSSLQFYQSGRGRSLWRLSYCSKVNYFWRLSQPEIR